MTLLGKIFTVLIMVMSVVFMSFSIVVYATHTNWKAEAEGLKQNLDQQLERNQQLEARKQRLLDNLALEQAARRHALASLETKWRQSYDTLQQRERELTNLQTSEGEAVAQVAAAQGLNQQLTTEVSTLRTDIRAAQRDVDEKFARVVALTDQYNQAKRLAEQLEQTQAPLYSQLAGYEDILRKMGIRFDVEEDGTVVSDVNRIPPDIKGQVVAVSDEELVEISIGSDDGLKIGHELDVYRDNTYLGRVRVRRTNPDKSIVEILKPFQKGIIRKGDSVATKLS